LTVLANLNPSSLLLAEKYEEAVAGFIELPYCEIERTLEAGLSLVANDWHAEARLKATPIL
jgi:hypothetical protein